MKLILPFILAFITYFAQAQTNFHHHELLGGIGFSSKHAGYRYHFSERWAIRSTWHTTSFGNAYGWGGEWFDMHTAKIGAQWTTSAAPFHALFSLDMAAPFLSRNAVNNHYYYAPPTVHTHSSKDNGVGIGLCVGAGAEWLIKNRVALQLYTQFTYYNVNSQGIYSADGIDTPYTKQYTKTHNDILAVSVSYCFF